MRIIGKIELKDRNVIKPIRYEGVRNIGDPNILLNKFYNLNLDEIFILNSVSTLYETNWVLDFLKKISKRIFIPLMAGGGIKSVDTAEAFIRSGADKISICSAITNNLKLLEKISKKIGSQSTVASIQAVKIENEWYGFKAMGRTNSKKKVTELIKEFQSNGAGEIIVTSVMDDGVMKGLNLELLEICNNVSKIPLIICGGLNGEEKLKFNVDAICGSSIFHFTDTNGDKLRNTLL
tara:strand:+ start:373 stop:1080 length:708 start_codon:yes stop_codon:yes gene_type:complete